MGRTPETRMNPVGEFADFTLNAASRLIAGYGTEWRVPRFMPAFNVFLA
jgi:hypothetical protein